MNRIYFKYIFSDLVGKGVPLITLLFLGSYLGSSQVEKVELIYLVQGLLINVLSFGQVHVYSRSLTFKNSSSNFYLLFAPTLFFLIISILFKNTVFFLASITALFQQVLNLTQINHNLNGKHIRQQTVDMLVGICFSIILILFVVNDFVDYRLKALTQLTSTILIILIFCKKTIKDLFKEISYKVGDINTKFIPYFFFSLIQWIILFFDKYNSRTYLQAYEADSFFLFTLMTNSLIVINLSVLKVIRNDIHKKKINIKNMAYIITRSTLFITFGSLFAFLFLFVIGEEILINYFVLNVLITILFSGFNYLLTFYLQGIEENKLSSRGLLIIGFSMVVLISINFLVFKSFLVFMVICIVTLLCLNIFLLKHVLTNKVNNNEIDIIRAK